jgi:hypothetical protein
MDELYANLDSLTPKLRENLATFEERARNNEKVMLLVRDVPLDFTLDDLTLGGWHRQEVNAFFERYEMNSVRTRMGKLMSDGLLGESATPEVSEAPPTLAPSRPEVALRPESSLAVVLRDAEAPLVAFNHERVAVFNATSGAIAVVSLAEFFEGAGEMAFAGHDVRTLYRRAGEAGFSLRGARGRHLDHGVLGGLHQRPLRPGRRGAALPR